MNIYKRNKPLINSIVTGLFYFVFCWSIDLGDSTKAPFIILMLFLPGLTFPITTCYFKTNTTNEDMIFLHAILSVGIYHGSVWIFSGEGRVKFITIIAGFIGSLFFQVMTKYVLRKKLNFGQIAITAILSGLAFLPFELIGRFGLLTGLAVFLWTIINGFLINFEYRQVPYKVNRII